MYKKFVMFLVVLAIPLLIFLASFKVLLFNEDFYDQEFEKLGVYDEFGKEDIQSWNAEVLAYLKGDGELTNPSLNEKERAHFADVKALLQKLFMLIYILAGIVIVGLILLWNKELFFKTVMKGLLGCFVLLILFAIAGLLNFDEIFTKFHEVSFSNDDWKMDPAVDKTINVYPDSFFKDFVTKLIMNSFIVLLIIAGVVLGMKKLVKVLDDRRD